MAERVLIVDDDKDFVEINKIAFETAGYEVLSAYDGEEGFQKASNGKPDAIVLDVMMKTKTEGFDVARTLDPEDDYMPVVEFIEKPITPERLIEKVKQMLEKK